MRKTGALAGTLLTTPYGSKAAPRLSNRTLNAFYIRAHTYTLVPAQVRQDLDWMADIGTNAITVSVLEQDLIASKNNILFIIGEAKKRNMKVYMVPTRWAGIFAGGTKVPSLFSVRNPHTWTKKEDGTTAYSKSTGVSSSFHFPEVQDFFIENLAKAIKQWSLDGVVWDEPKIWKKDYTDLGKQLAGYENIKAHYQAAAAFMNQMSAGLKQQFPNLELLYYTGADTEQEIIDFQLQLKQLAYYGCSGLPWSKEVDIPKRKYSRYLLDQVPVFQRYAKSMEAKSMAVIKNMYIESTDHQRYQRYLEDVIALKPDNLTYYYYPRNLAEPDVNMNILKAKLPTFHLDP